MKPALPLAGSLVGFPRSDAVRPPNSESAARHDGLDAVFSSDLARAVETVDVAFASSDVPVLLDWRLRECNYGELNGMPRDRVHTDRLAQLATPFPGGESWQEAVGRVGRFLADLLPRWDGARLLVVGHVATQLGLDHHLRGVAVADARICPCQTL
jgi:2,3-bisphosphoglycerate-dependent phosphoglycerate mutase